MPYVVCLENRTTPFISVTHFNFRLQHQGELSISNLVMMILLHTVFLHIVFQ